MEKQTATLIYFGFIGVVTIFMVFTVYYIIHFKEAFMSNPLVYGAGKMGIDCTCRQWDTQGRFVVAQFFVNGSGMSKVEPLFGYPKDIDLNISFVNIST
jgi:hypothetical protein